MKYLMITLMVVMTLMADLLAGCGNGADKAGADGKAASKTGREAKDSSGAASGGSNPASGGSTAEASGANALIDTAQLQKDMSSVLNGIASGKPDTAALKKAMVDFGSTSQKMLSDSGIDALYGHSNDPAVRSAAAAVKRLRNASGLTPDKLDSLKKAMDVLKAN
jgi:hypothetical protein